MSEWSEVVKSIQSVSDYDKQMIAMTARMTEAIIERRKELGFTQEEVATRTGLKQSAVARLESGATIPRIDTLVKVAVSLGLDVRFMKAPMDEQAATQVAG